MATVCAIVLPLTVFKNRKEEKIEPIIPVVNQALPSTEVAYSVSTLCLANAISANTSIFTEVQHDQENNDWNEWNGWNSMPNGQDSLREVLKYCSQYMYVADKMLDNTLTELPDKFTHESLKDGTEQYNCVFNKDKEFECYFNFKEKLSEDKSDVRITGVLGVKGSDLVVEGTRKNVSIDKPSNVQLDVKFEKSKSNGWWWEEQRNPILSFKQRTDAKDNIIYSFEYNERRQNVYIVEMSCDKSYKVGENAYSRLNMNVTTYYNEAIFWPGSGHGSSTQSKTYNFVVEKDYYGNLVLYLYWVDSYLFIDVRDKNGYYYYYLSEFNKDDPFGEYGKH